MTLLLSLFLLLVFTFWPLIVADNKVFTLPLIPHSVQRERRGLLAEDLSPAPRRRSLQQDSLIIGALYQGYGTHYVDLWVGSPNPQRQTVIVDTGSGVTAFPCSGCNDCGADYHIDAFFQESLSSSFEKLTCDECTRGSCSHDECRIGMSYQEGSSWSAYEGRDVTYAGGPHDEPLTQNEDNGGDDVDPHHASAYAFPLKFGCQTKITGLFKTQLADGIMGMDNASTSYWSQMHVDGKLEKRRFSLCYSRQPTSTREGTEAGALTFGGPDSRLHTSPMVYSGGKEGRVGFFSVRMRKVYLRQGGGGDSATSTKSDRVVTPLDVSEDTLNRGGIIVDSGTTDTYFSRSIASAFSKVFEDLTGKKYGHDPVDLSPDQLDALPTILFQIVGDASFNEELHADATTTTGLAGALDPEHPYDVLLAMPPSHYMEYDSKKEKYIARFYTDEGGGSVLGGNAIMGHDVYFDMENNLIGWAESKCDYTELVEKYDTTANVTPQEETPSTSEKEAVEKEEDTTTDKDTTHGENNNVPDVEEPTHEEDKHVDKPSEVDSDATKSGYNPSNVCTGIKCRASVLAALMGVLFVGIFVGRTLSSRNRGARYHATELEVPTLHLDADDAVDFSTRYRDHPEGEVDEEDGVADEGVGYEEDDELDPREIA